MRDYATISAKFWVGQTGRQFRGDADAQRLAFYLMTCPSSNMIGMYYLPLPTLCHEVGIPFEGASKGLRRLEDLNFAAYDHESEWVWVYEMARFQIAESLEPKDNRVKSINRQFADCYNCRFAKAFHDKYKAAFHLVDIPEREQKTAVKVSPFEAPSKPLDSPFEAREQEQEQEQDKKTAPKIETPPPAEIAPAPVPQPEPKQVPAPAAKSNSHGMWGWIKNEDLHDVGKIINWFNRVSKGKHPLIGSSETDRLNVVAAAVHSWTNAEDPHKLFCWIIHNREFGCIKAIEEDTAYQMVKEYLHREEPVQRKGKVETVGDTLREMFPEVAK